MFASRTNWPLEPNRFAAALEEHRRRGRPILDLTVSNPTLCGFSYPQERILAALNHPRALGYEPESKGLLSARGAIAGYYSGRSGFFKNNGTIDPERIVITSGTSEAYDYVFRLLCDAGDEILVPAPSYPLFEFLADLADIRAVAYPLFYEDGWHIDFEALKEGIRNRSKAIVVVHPNNPTGSFVKKHEAQRLVEISARRELAIIADEVFLDYVAAPDARPSFGFESEVLTFTLSGISKISLLPQMKIGWILVSGPENLVSAAIHKLDIIGDTYLSAGTPAQLALPELLELRGGLQSQMGARVDANLASLDNAFPEHSAVTRLKREGGWYAVLRVPATSSDEDLSIALLERSDVLVHPGHFFDFPHDGFLVLSLIEREGEFREGIERLEHFFLPSAR